MDNPENLPELLKQFRENLSDILTPTHTDAVLLKWLKARNYNLKKSEINFREVDANRKLFGVNNILTGTYEKPEVTAKYERTDIIGNAKDGSPIRYACFGVDFQGFLMSMSGYDICLYMSYCMESNSALLQRENEKTGRELNETTFICDMEDFTLQDCMHKCVAETSMDLMRLVQDHYPECWTYILIVNAPLYFQKLFNIVKPIFRPNLMEKIFVTSKTGTGELLRQYIDEDVLPAFLGGKRVDSNGDPKCREYFPNMAHSYCKIPSEYYIKNRRPPLSPQDPGVQCAVVSPRSVFNIVFNAEQENERFHVKFRTENGSISFTLFYKEDEEGDLPASNEKIVPYEGFPRYRIVSATLRLQSHCTEVDAYCTVPRTGKYILQFDNSGSWFASRKLIYHIIADNPS